MLGHSTKTVDVNLSQAYLAPSKYLPTCRVHRACALLPGHRHAFFRPLGVVWKNCPHRYNLQMFSTGPAVSMRLAPATENAWHPALACFGWALASVGHAKHIAACRFAQIWTTPANPRPALVTHESTNE